MHTQCLWKWAFVQRPPAHRGERPRQASGSLEGVTRAKETLGERRAARLVRSQGVCEVRGASGRNTDTMRRGHGHVTALFAHVSAPALPLCLAMSEVCLNTGHPQGYVQTSAHNSEFTTLTNTQALRRSLPFPCRFMVQRLQPLQIQQHRSRQDGNQKEGTGLIFQTLHSIAQSGKRDTSLC